MSWRELLQRSDETIVAPWLAGRALRTEARAWTIDGDLPSEHGWHAFRPNGRRATWTGATEAASELLRRVVRGFLVGDRLVREDAASEPDPMKIVARSERVHLVPDGIERFARVAAGTAFDGGPLVFASQELPLGPEDDVLIAFLDRARSVDAVRAVPPALDAAFRMETFRRDEIERRRREEEEQRQREERRRELLDQLGNGATRRAMAALDFEDAARAALAIGGAEYLEHRRANRHEMLVRFRVGRRRFECTCDARTLRIIDSGICLVDHGTGERGDTYFTLESLPGVIQQAERQGALVVFRHHA